MRLLSAIGFMQQQNVIHADLKPDNLLLQSGQWAAFRCYITTCASAVRSVGRIQMLHYNMCFCSQVSGPHSGATLQHVLLQSGQWAAFRCYITTCASAVRSVGRIQGLHYNMCFCSQVSGPHSGATLQHVHLQSGQWAAFRGYITTCASAVRSVGRIQGLHYNMCFCSQVSGPHSGATLQHVLLQSGQWAAFRGYITTCASAVRSVGRIQRLHYNMCFCSQVSGPHSEATLQHVLLQSGQWAAFRGYITTCASVVSTGDFRDEFQH